MKPKRYNIGFGWFGPLEQADDGKLMLADEVDKIIDQKGQEISHWEAAYDEAIDECINADENYFFELKRSNRLENWLQIAATTAVIEAVLLVFAVWG